MTPRELSLDLYRRMLLIRRAEELIQKHYPEDEMKTPMHMSMGEEAIVVGVCAALGADGLVTSSYRSHAVYLAKADETDGFFAELYGRTPGVAGGRAGSMHLSAPEQGYLGASAVVASAIPIAAGAAFAQKRLRTGRGVATFFGDGALEEGAFWESLNAACLWKLPLLMVCGDNGLSVHTPKSARQGFADITRIASGFACSVYRDETTDVERIYSLTQQALTSIRERGGPAFLHLHWYRYLEHVGVAADFDAGYREITEFQDWERRDPLRVQRDRLLNIGVTKAEIATLESQVDRQLQTSLHRAQSAPHPEVHTLTDSVTA